MTDIKDAVHCEPIACNIPIPINISFFHSNRSISAQLVDHSGSGICFISKHFFLQGTPIVFKIDYKAVDPSHNCHIERLPSMNVGEITWCNELTSGSSTPFKVGVKFYPQPY